MNRKNCRKNIGHYNKEVFYQPLYSFLLNTVKSKGLILLIFITIFIFSANTQCSAGNGITKFSSAATKLVSNHQYKKAVEILTIGIKKYPNAKSLYYQRAVIQDDWLGEYKDAILGYTIYLKLGIDKDYEHAKIYYRRGVCLCNLNSYQLGIKDFNKAIYLTPRYDKAYYARAEAYAKIGAIDKAISDMKKCVEISPKYKRMAETFLKKLIQGN